MKTKSYMFLKNLSMGCFLSVLLFLSQSSKAISVWEHAYTPIPAFLNSVVNTSDGGFLAVGYTNSLSINDFIMIKSDFNGNLIWQDTIPYNRHSYISVVRELTPGNIYVLGVKDTSLLVLHYDLYDHLLDSNAYNISGALMDRMMPIEILTNGTGFTIGGQLNNDAVFKVELDASMNLISLISATPNPAGGTKTFTGFIRTSDNQYLMAMNWTNYTYMAHLDTAFVADTTYDYGYAFIFTNTLAHRNYFVPSGDGNYFYAAREGSSTTMRIYKVAPSGDTIWTRRNNVGVYLAPAAMGATPDGGCLVIAHYSSPYDMITMKFDNMGNLTNMATIVKPGTDEFINDIEPTSDGHLIISGASGAGPNYYPYMAKIDISGELYTNVIEGLVYYDANDNCVHDVGEILIPNQFVSISPAASYSVSNANGVYRFNVDTGTYTVSIYNGLDTNMWVATCPSSGQYDTNFTTNDYHYSSHNDFGFHANYLCTILNVDVGSDLMRSCRATHHYVSYENTGSDTAFNAYIDIVIDTPLYFTGASIPYTQIDSLFHFPIGDVPPFASGSFVIDDTLSCTAVTGSTICVRADIFPKDTCAYIDTSVNGGDYILSSDCVGDTVVNFTVRYRGSRDMDTSRQIRVYEDDILTRTDTVHLNIGGQSVFSIRIGADKTYTLQADLDPRLQYTHVMQTHRELCGFSGLLPYPNFVMRFPQFDEAPNFEIDCREIVASLDPNLKTVVPKGFRAPNYINANQSLEYTINFQNTGNDTAFRIFILDTISSFLDIRSVHPGVSSHKYTWNVIDDNVLQFTFENIMLPDSGIDEPNSHGFVKYKINQINDNPKGTLIENMASIYFDYNAPVNTNTAFVTIYDTTFISLSAPTILQENNQLLVYPNPTNERIFFKLNSTQAFEDIKIQISDISGQIVKAVNSTASNLSPIEVKDLGAGMYLYKISNNKGVVATGKFVVQH